MCEISIKWKHARSVVVQITNLLLITQFLIKCCEGHCKASYAAGAPRVWVIPIPSSFLQQLWGHLCAPTILPLPLSLPLSLYRNKWNIWWKLSLMDVNYVSPWPRQSASLDYLIFGNLGRRLCYPLSKMWNWSQKRLHTPAQEKGRLPVTTSQPRHWSTGLLRAARGVWPPSLWQTHLWFPRSTQLPAQRGSEIFVKFKKQNRRS